MAKYQQIVCPKCSAVFSVVEGDDVVLCESCDHAIDLSGESEMVDETEDVASEDAVDDKTSVDEEADRQLLETMEAERLAKLLKQLPPKFLANDPDFVDHRVSREQQSKVLIPRADGGVQSVDTNVVRINHNGQIVELIALTPEKRRKRRWWINLVSIGLGGIFLLLFFLWLNQ